MISLNIATLQVKSVAEKIDCYLFEGKASFEFGSICPACQGSPSKLLSYYYRTVQDLPINGKRVEFHIKARKLQFQNTGYSVKYFVQNLDFVRPSSLKTQRLEDMILEISIPTSLIQATFILNHLGIK